MHNSRTYRATWNIRSIFPFGSDLSHQSLPSPIWREVRQTTHELHTILWQANMAMINSYIMGIHYDIFPINRYFMVFPIARQLTTRGLDTEIRPKLPWLLALTEAPAEFLTQVSCKSTYQETKPRQRPGSVLAKLLSLSCLLGLYRPYFFGGLYLDLAGESNEF